MNKITRIAAGVALATAAAASQAGVVLTTPSLTGFYSLTGFADGTPDTFTATFRDLKGTVTASSIADGRYGISIDTGSGPTTIFSGLLDTSGPSFLNQSFTFKDVKPGVNDAKIGAATFTLAYDGATDPDLMSLLAMMTGYKFVDPTGKGSMTVNAQLFTDGIQLAITETSHDWTGFGNLLAAADRRFGGGNGVIDDSFTLSNVTVRSEVPEPASLALAGLALAGAAAASRRRKS